MRTSRSASVLAGLGLVGLVLVAYTPAFATTLIPASDYTSGNTYQMPGMNAMSTTATEATSDDVTGGDYTVSASEVRDGDFTVTGGNLGVYGTLVVRGNLTVTGGDLLVGGKLVVKGNLIVTGGDINTQPNSTKFIADFLTLDGGRIYVRGKTTLTGGQRLGNGAKLPSLVAQIDPLLDTTLYGDSELGVLSSIVASDKELLAAKKALIARFNTGESVDTDIAEALASRKEFFESTLAEYIDTGTGVAAAYSGIVAKTAKADENTFKRYITLTQKAKQDLVSKLNALKDDTARRTYADQVIGKANLAIENSKTPKAQLRKQKALKAFYEEYIDNNLTPEATVTNVSLEILPAKN